MIHYFVKPVFKMNNGYQEEEQTKNRSQVRILPPRPFLNNKTLREIEGFLVSGYFVRFNQKGANIMYYGYTFYGYSMDTLPNQN